MDEYWRSRLLDVQILRAAVRLSLTLPALLRSPLPIDKSREGSGERAAIEEVFSGRPVANKASV
jgi:hypothetical protein